jgi:valyl-tRNA synthetase
VQAVEERSVRQVQKFLADDFRTARHSNSQQLRSFMLLHFRQNKVIKVFTSNIQIVLQKEKADMVFNVLVTGSSNWLPERGRRFEVKSRWIKQDGDWKISRVNWQELTDFH